MTPGASPTSFTAIAPGSPPSSAVSDVANHEIAFDLSAYSFSAITFSAVNPPAGMTVAPTSSTTSGTQTVLVTWTPNASYVGTTSFTAE